MGQNIKTESVLVDHGYNNLLVVSEIERPGLSRIGDVKNFDADGMHKRQKSSWDI